MTTTNPRRPGYGLLIAAAVLLIPLVLFLAGVFDDDEPSSLVPEATPTASDDDTATATPEPSGDDDADAGPVRSDPDQAVPDDAPAAVQASLDAAEDGTFTDVRSILRGDRLHLIGSVPDVTAAQRVNSLAAAIAGDADVLDFVVIDDRAPRPDEYVLRVDLPVRFDAGTNAITPRSEALVDDLAASLASELDVGVEVVGHTDDEGDEIANLDLSLRRAQAVVDRLVEAGVARDRLTASGRGETRPIADNDTDRGRERNRRIELVVSDLDLGT